MDSLEAEHIAAATAAEAEPGQAIETEGFTGVDPVLHDAAVAKIATLEIELSSARAEITSLKTSLYDKMSGASSVAQVDDIEVQTLGDEDTEVDPDMPREYADLFDDVDDEKKD